MPLFRTYTTYEDRDRSRNIKRGFAAATGIFTLTSAVVFLSDQSRAKFITKLLGSAIRKTGEYIDERLGTSISSDLIKSSKAIRTFGLENSSLYRDLESFNRLVSTGIPRQAQAERAVQYLTHTYNWTEESARLLFQPVDVPYDIMRTDPRRALASPWYRKHVLPTIRHTRSIGAVEQQVTEALKVARAVRGEGTADALNEANRTMFELLSARSKRSGPLSKHFGIKERRLGSMVDAKFTQSIKEVVRETSAIQDPWTRRRTFFSRLAEQRALSNAELMYARAANIAVESGHANWSAFANALPVGITQVGDTVINTARLSRTIGVIAKNFADDFQIPIAPGLVGLQPFKFFPWIRGYSETFAGTLAAGTKQRDLQIALEAQNAADDLFTAAGVLRRDIHFIGNKLLGLPGEWSMRDARVGFMRDYARIRQNEGVEVQGSVRNWFGDSFVGHVMDFLGLDKQTQPSKLSDVASVIGRRISPDSEKYARHPANILQRIIEGGNDIDDIEGLLIALRCQHRDFAGVDLNNIFGTAARDLLPRGFVRLLDEGMSDEALVQALHEIHAINAGTPIQGARFFGQNTPRKMFLNPALRNLADRMEVNPFEVLYEGEEVVDKLGIVNASGLLGRPDAIRGRQRLVNAILDELVSQVANSQASSRDTALNEILRNIISLQDISFEQRSSMFSNIWAGIQEAAFYSSAAKQKATATAIATSLRQNADALILVNEAIERAYPDLSSWVQPAFNEFGGIHTSVYAVPEWRGVKTLWQGVLDAYNSGRGTGTAADGVRSVIEHSVALASNYLHERPFWAGETQTPGSLYHSGYRLNQMLAEFGLGLPDKDLQTTTSIYGNLFLKRILPTFGAIEAWKYINHESDEVTGMTPSEGLANIRAHYHLAASWISDHLGITARAKRLVSILPGVEQYVEPRTVEEQRDYLNEGYEPVRAGRGWLTGTRTPFLGGKIRYWSPSWYQLATSNWQSAENVDLNTDDYWAHSIIPTPSHPFAPIWRFLDPYWFENKHSVGENADRPYVVSGQGGGDPNTLWGNIWNVTIGRITKPTRVLHPEYAVGGELYEDAINGTNRDKNERYFAMFAPRGGIGVYGSTLTGGNPALSDAGISGGGQGGHGGVGSQGGYGGGGGQGGYGGGGGQGGYGGGGGQGGYGGGGGRGANGGTAQLPRDWRRLPRKNTAAYSYGYTAINPTWDLAKAPTAGLDPISPYEFNPVRKRVSKQVEDILGIYGFISTSTGERLNIVDQSVSAPIIATPDQATSWEGRWYDREWGGVGGDVNELLRRVVVHKDRNRKLYNPVPNTQAPWMPGPDALIPMTTGDPYTAVPFGNVRVPGEAYERLHEDVMMPLFRTRASALGKSEEEIADAMLGRVSPLTDYGEYVTEWGNKAHKAVQKQWAKLGVLEASERRMVDQEHNISGHMDAILNIEGKRYVADIKTVGGEKYNDLRGPIDEHVAQVNFYQHELGIDRGQIYYINRDDPSAPIKVYNLSYKEQLYKDTIAKVQNAKKRVVEMINSGEAARGELYDPVSRVEVLANLQPWSTEYKTALQQARTYVTGEDDPIFQQELSKRLQAARKRASKMRKQTQIHDYKFLQHTKSRTVTITDIIDANTFGIAESKRPIRLAGVKASTARIQEWMRENNRRVESGDKILDAFYGSMGIFRGAKVKAVVSEDDTISNDTMGTTHAAIFAVGGNINKRLIRMGVGIEEDSDDSAAGIVGRYSPFERFIGGTYERFAHIDTPWGRKLGAPASALELYKRTQVYGTNAGDWAHPISTYVIPTMNALAGRNPLLAALSGGMIGSFFMRSQTGKLLAATAGAVAGVGLSLYGKAAGVMQGGTFIPKRVEKRREVEEYYDVLEFVKDKHLEAVYARKAEKEEGINIRSIEARQQARGAAYGRKMRKLANAKRRLKLNLSISKDKRDRETTKINRYIAGLQRKNRAAYPVSENVAMMLAYRERAKRTIIGSDPSNPRDALAGMPKYERELIEDIINNGSKSEKRELFALLPRNQKAAFGKSLGIRAPNIPKKVSLEEYFRTHSLPDASWAGWNPEFDLDHARAIAAQEEGINPIEMEIYPRNILDAKLATENVPVPTVNGTTTLVRDTLKSILTARGLHDIDIDLSVIPGNETRSDIDVEVQHDRTDEFIKNLAV